MTAKPFLRWAGGKSKLVPEILKRFPATYGKYHEPFLGGGAVFFALKPNVAYLSDMNAELIQTYCAVKNQSDELVEMLDDLARHQSEAAYLRVRAMEVSGDLHSAARMIYLNKCNFNGLYRVNKSGKFNVPWGKRTDVSLYDDNNLLACTTALQNAEIACRGFETVLEYASPGDIVFCDPPYAPVSATADFTAYTKDGFTWEDQVGVHDVANTLRSRGCHVVLSNAGIPAIAELYKDWRCDEVMMRRNVNSDGAKRGKVSEFLIW